ARQKYLDAKNSCVDQLIQKGFHYFLEITQSVISHNHLNLSLNVNERYLQKLQFEKFNSLSSVEKSQIYLGWRDAIHNKFNIFEQYIEETFPQLIFEAVKISYYAVNKSRDLFSSNELYQGKGDAYRHILWAALMTKFIGKDFAALWSTIHEFESFDPVKCKLEESILVSQDNLMDLENNKLGIDIGERYKYTQNSLMENYILQLVNNNQACTIEKCE
ncbi:hypothetical protein N9N67_12655, partial [Bacteriovoracaceae bacterium]|nr:hypothetical protein [Bacteriovoracaceae bacterium]